jgi:hypothetical protein
MLMAIIATKHEHRQPEKRVAVHGVVRALAGSGLLSG